MNDNTRKAISDMSVSAAVTASLCFFFYAVVIVWWSGIVEANAEQERLRHETCYQRFAFNEAHQTHWIVESYCGEDPQ